MQKISLSTDSFASQNKRLWLCATGRPSRDIQRSRTYLLKSSRKMCAEIKSLWGISFRFRCDDAASRENFQRQIRCKAPRAWNMYFRKCIYKIETQRASVIPAGLVPRYKIVSFGEMKSAPNCALFEFNSEKIKISTFNQWNLIINICRERYSIIANPQQNSNELINGYSLSSNLIQLFVVVALAQMNREQPNISVLCGLRMGEKCIKTMLRDDDGECTSWLLRSLRSSYKRLLLFLLDIKRKWTEKLWTKRNGGMRIEYEMDRHQVVES